MNQPELGKTIQELRVRKGITQKELSDTCTVDIRTIQRIEAGEVTPRGSTLKLLARTLGCDEDLFRSVPPELPSPPEFPNPDQSNTLRTSSNTLRTLLIFSMMAGVSHLFNWFFYIPILPADMFPFLIQFRVFFTLIYILAGVVFFFGFYMLARHQKNLTLQIASLIIVVLIPLSALSDMVASINSFHFVRHVHTLSLILINVNGFAFGIGLFLARSRFRVWYLLAGVLQILITPIFLIPVPIIQMMGIWLSVPFLALLILIQLLELIGLYAQSQKS